MKWGRLADPCNHYRNPWLQPNCQIYRLSQSMRMKRSAPSGAYDFEERTTAVAIDGDVVYWTAPAPEVPYDDEDSPLTLYRTCR